MALFLGEQLRARHGSEYVRRSYELPLYPRLFFSPNGAFEAGVSQPEERTEFPEVRPLRPRSVVFLILESVQGASLGPDVTPALEALAKESLRFPNATSEAIATSLVWNTIFMDRVPETFGSDRSRSGAGHGSPVLEYYRSVGYQVGLAISTHLRIKDYDRRILGDSLERFRSFVGYDEKSGGGRAEDDRRTVDRALEWIAGYSPKKPFFLVTQIEATHFPYDFDPKLALERGYTEELDGVKMRDASEISLYYKRYRNALASVDRQVARLVAGLKAKGIYAETAIVVVSDHGEDFRVRKLFHLRLSRPVRSGFPYYLRLPGVAPGVDSRLASHRDLFPTILDYIGVPPTARPKTLGTSLLASGPKREGILTWSGSLGFAEWTSSKGSIRLETRVRDGSIRFFPVARTNGDDEWDSSAPTADPNWDWRAEVIAWLSPSSYRRD